MNKSLTKNDGSPKTGQIVQGSPKTGQQMVDKNYGDLKTDNQMGWEKMMEVLITSRIV